MTRYDSVLTPAPVVAHCGSCGEPYSAHLSRCSNCEDRPAYGLHSIEDQAALYQQHALAVERRTWKTL